MRTPAKTPTMKHIATVFAEMLDAAFARGSADAVKKMVTATNAHSLAPKQTAPPIIKRAVWGTAPRLTLEILEREGDGGVTPALVQAYAKRNKIGLARSSIRESLKKMRRNGGATYRDGRWYPIHKPARVSEGNGSALAN